MNVFTCVGNMVKDVELKYSQSGTAFASFTIAVKRQFKDKASGQYESDFISCKAFGKTAELLANYTSKGSKIAVQGSIQTGSYEKNGTKVYTTDVMVNQVTFLDSKKEEFKAVQGDKSLFDKKQDPFSVNSDPFAVTSVTTEVNEDDFPF